MSSSVRIELAAGRYALALIALRRAKRSWHQLDAALVAAQQSGVADSQLAHAQDALMSLDRQLDRLATLLGW